MVVEFPGVMPLIAEIQIHYRPVLELKEAEHFMYEIRRACCVQELTGAPLVEQVLLDRILTWNEQGLGGEFCQRVDKRSGIQPLQDAAAVAGEVFR